MFQNIIFFAILCHATANEQIDVGIVGAGIGGTSSAFFLKKLLKNRIKTDVFERKKVGGRLATVEIGDRTYECGGTVIHPANQHMVAITDDLGLSTNVVSETSNGNHIFSLFNGKDFVFEGCTWSLCTAAKLLWEYGYNLVKLQSWVDSLLSMFGRIYELQSSGYAYTDVGEMLKAMSGQLFNMSKSSTRAALKSEGLSDYLIETLVMAGLRVNYGQTPSIHGFVGGVSLAGVQKGLWNVVGGNMQVPIKLLAQSEASLIPHEVTKIVYNKNGPKKFTIEYTDGGSTKTRNYDLVILGAPLPTTPAAEDETGEWQEYRPVQLANFPRPVPRTPFHRTVATYVRGSVNASYFGKATSEEVPSTVLTTEPSLFFNSIAVQTPVDGGPVPPEKIVWKVFSPRPLTKSQLDTLFESRDEVVSCDWLAAYPSYADSENLHSFTPGPPGFYQVSSVENAASAMEMSVIAGKNIAQLIHNQQNHLCPAKCDTVPQIEGDEITEHEL